MADRGQALSGSEAEEGRGESPEEETYAIMDNSLFQPIQHDTRKKYDTIFGGCYCTSVTHLQNYLSVYTASKSRGSSVSIVSDCGLDNRVLIPDRDFSSSLCIQTGSGAHPAPCPMGTGGKARPGVTLTTHPYLVLRLRTSRSCNPPLPQPPPPPPSWHVVGHLYLYLLHPFTIILAEFCLALYRFLKLVIQFKIFVFSVHRY
jgi:hypothetical protein